MARTETKRECATEFIHDVLVKSSDTVVHRLAQEYVECSLGEAARPRERVRGCDNKSGKPEKKSEGRAKESGCYNKQRKEGVLQQEW